LVVEEEHLVVLEVVLILVMVEVVEVLPMEPLQLRLEKH
jgi:hypothetical protein